MRETVSRKLLLSLIPVLLLAGMSLTCKKEELKLNTFFLLGSANGPEWLTVPAGDKRVYSFSVTDYMAILPGHRPLWHLNFHVHDGDTLSWMLIRSEPYQRWLVGEGYFTEADGHGCVLDTRAVNVPFVDTYYLVFLNHGPQEVELDGYSSVDWWEMQ